MKKPNRRLSPEGIPIDPLAWLEDDFRDLHFAIDGAIKSIAARHRENKMKQEVGKVPSKGSWVTLYELPPGSLFETKDGIRAMKTEYRTFNNASGLQVDCYLLDSGEAAHFKHGDKELVRALDIYQ